MKEPLYRKVNSRTHHVSHKGPNFRHERHTKGQQERQEEGGRTAMHGKRQRGLDYTPLFRFLLSRVGQQWDAVYGEAVARLDRPDPIFQMVALREDERQECFLNGNSSYFSGLFVDGEGRLQVVAPELTPATFEPSCSCCTHTFNGLPVIRKYGER